jgi:hypothetical protein
MICWNNSTGKTAFSRYFVAMQRLSKQLFYGIMFLMVWWFFVFWNITLAQSTVEYPSAVCATPKIKNSVTTVCECPTGTKEVNGECKPCNDPGVCCGVELNTSIPFIGSCIESSGAYLWWDETSVTWQEAFPTLIGSLTKILVSIILIASFILIVFPLDACPEAIITPATTIKINEAIKIILTNIFVRLPIKVGKASCHVTDVSSHHR